MNLSSGASDVSPLVFQIACSDHATTRITIVGRADSSNRDHLRRALCAVDVPDMSRVELALARLEFCDVEAAVELLAFASRISDPHDAAVAVAVVDATAWVAAMLILLDVEGVVAMPAPSSGSPNGTWLTTDLPPGQATALLQFMMSLDHDGAPTGSGPVRGSRSRTQDQSPPGLT